MKGGRDNVREMEKSYSTFTFHIKGKGDCEAVKIKLIRQEKPLAEDQRQRGSVMQMIVLQTGNCISKLKMHRKKKPLTARNKEKEARIIIVM